MQGLLRSPKQESDSCAQAVGENDASTCTDGVEHLDAEKLPYTVASASLKGFITPTSAGCATDVLPGLWEAQSEKHTQCGREQHR